MLHLTKDGALKLDMKDEITRGCLITHGGEVVQERVRRRSSCEARKPEEPRRRPRRGAAAMHRVRISSSASTSSRWRRFVGYQVISRVPPLLHTPLMSGHQRHQRHLAGRLAGRGRRASQRLSTDPASSPSLCATINVVGGFLITDRMLRMFKRTEEDPHAA